MKTLLRFFIGFFLLIACTAQRQPAGHIPITSVITTQTEALTSTAYPAFLSNYARLFLHSLAQEIPLCSIPENYVPGDRLMRQFPIGILRDSIFCITGFLEVKQGFRLEKLKKLGIYFTQGNELFSTAYIPLYAICDFLKLQGIVRFELTRRTDLLLNVARPAVNAQIILDPIAGTRQYDGNGVIIGLVDYGFDYTHPDFYDSTGTIYRIKRVWEQTKTGNTPARFPYGRELANKTAILAAGTDTEQETHGTHVAGIASGSGSGTQYYGLAPAADIVMVSTNRTDAGIADGLKYIADYAAATNKPCVINFSLGSSMGPHDGTSAFDRLCEREARPGLLFTGSAGNQGNKPIYLGYSFAENMDTVIKSAIFPLIAGEQIIADIWGIPGTRFSAGIALMDTLLQQEIGKTPLVMTGDSAVSSFKIKADSTLAIIQIAAETGKYNHKPTLMVQIDLSGALPSSVIPILKIGASTPTQISCWLIGGIFNNLHQPAEFLSGSDTHTISEIGGTGKAIISAGAFCTKNQWTDVTGKYYEYGPLAIMGDIAYFSAKGPTADGRIKPDISCPGYGVVSAFSHFFTGNYPPLYYRVLEKGFNNSIYYWGILQGTSEAAPIVAGTLALWLQKNPMLTPDEAKRVVHETAVPGGNVPLPNNTWGWGILNAGKGLSVLRQK